MWSPAQKMHLLPHKQRRVVGQESQDASRERMPLLYCKCNLRIAQSVGNFLYPDLPAYAIPILAFIFICWAGSYSAFERTLAFEDAFEASEVALSILIVFIFNVSGLIHICLFVLARQAPFVPEESVLKTRGSPEHESDSYANYHTFVVNRRYEPVDVTTPGCDSHMAYGSPAQRFDPLEDVSPPVDDILERPSFSVNSPQRHVNHPSEDELYEDNVYAMGPDGRPLTLEEWITTQHHPPPPSPTKSITSSYSSTNLLV